MKNKSASRKVEGNPFDKFSNAKKKHEVLNRRVKGEDRNVGRALAKAIDVRKTRLLTDYNKNKKSGSFIDKRFGENDITLSLEDKMLARFQKERLKKSRNASIFNLDTNVSSKNSSDEPFQLTHKGKILSDENYRENEWSDDDDENDALGKDLVNQLHFGGGLVASKSRNTDPSNHHITDHMTALQEIVAKSKMYKLQKKELKLEIQEETDKVDADFQSLLKSSMIEFRDDYNNKNKNKIDRPRNSSSSTSNNNDVDDYDDYDDYDKAFHQMSYEAKVQPTDRTKSLEEIAVENREKLDLLEKNRLDRMRQFYDPFSINDGDDDADDSGIKNKRNKKKKGSGKVVKQAATAMTDDDIDDFQIAEEEDENEDEDEETEDYDQEELEYDEDDEEDEDGEDDEEEENDEEDDDDDDDDGEDIDYNEEEDGDNDSEPQAFVQKTQSFIKPLITADHTIPTRESIPHNISCPDDIDGFDAFIQLHCKSYADIQLVIDRTLAYNSIHLPGSLGIENIKSMHIFLDILHTYYIRVANTMRTCKQEDSGDVQQQLDHLVACIFKLSLDIPETSVSLWIKFIKTSQMQFQKKLRDYTQGLTSNCWPSLGQMMSFQLLGLIFSSSDYRHAIVESCYLLLCQYLSQSPVSDVHDISCGLMCVSILMEMTKESKRIIPECLSFLGSVYGLYAPTSPSSSVSVHSVTGANSSTATATATSSINTQVVIIQKSFNMKTLQNVRQLVSEEIYKNSSTVLKWNVFFDKKSSHSSDSNESSVSYMSSILRVTQSLTALLIERYRDTTPAFYELFNTYILNNWQCFRPHNEPYKLDRNIILSHTLLLEKLMKLCQENKQNRKPLQWRKPIKFIIETKNPRYQVDYKLKRDIDPDQDRVKLKQLTRQKKREEKAAMRELRRDSEFLDQEKNKEKMTQSNKMKLERQKNFSWMEEQQASINEQVRKGGELIRGGGSSISKKPKIRR